MTKLHDGGCCHDGISIELRWCGQRGKYRALCFPCPHQPAFWDDSNDVTEIERADLHDMMIALEREVRLRQLRRMRVYTTDQ